MSDENNVTPIEPVQECASCGSRHTHRERFRLDAHNDGCMQPEIRMRRLEARVADLTEAIEELQGAHQALVELERMNADNRTVIDGIMATLTDVVRVQAKMADTSEKTAQVTSALLRKVTERDGINEASPDTQRSGSPEPDPERERRIRCHGDAGVCSYCPITQDSGEPHADTSSAEPERAPPAGAEPAGDPGGDT